MEIKINGKLLDVVDRSMVLELKNPMFGFNEVAGARAYDINIPGTDLVNKIFGKVYHPAVRAINQVYPTELTRGNNTIEKGVSVVRPAFGSAQTSGSDSSGRAATHGGFTLGFTSNYAELFGVNQNKTLREIDFGTQLFGAVQINASLANTYLINGWVLPTIANAKFYETGNAPGGWAGKVNDFAAGAFTAGVKTPMFFVKYILKALAASAGVTFKGTFWDSAEFSSMLFYSNQAASATIDIRKHLPALTIGQVLLGLRKSKNVVIRIDAPNKTIRMDFGKDLLKEIPKSNWNNKIRRIDSGTPMWSEGLRLRLATDGNDGFNKDAFYLPYETAASGFSLGYNEIESVFCSTLMNAGIPSVDQNGNTTGQEDKDCSPRLLYWIGGATPSASNSYGGVAFGSAALAAAYWVEQEKFFKSGFVATEMVKLSAVDIADISARFRGEKADAPIYHAWGVNWLIESLTVPGVEDEKCKVVMWRV